MKLTVTQAWLNASAHEAGRVGAAAIDVDHLYLGLLGIGGAAARLLGAHGVTLTTARARTQEMLATDLGVLGLAHGEGVIPPPRAQSDEAWPTDLRERARALVAASGKSPDTFALLVLLLQEPSGIIRRLVHADGVLPQDLAAPLKEGSDEPYSTVRAAVTPGLLPEPAFARSVTHFIAEPPQRVIAALRDPAALALLVPASDDGQDPTAPEGAVVTGLGGRRSLRLRAHLRAEEAGEDLTWVWEMLDTAWSGQNLTYHRFLAHEAPGGTDLTHTLGYRTFGVLGRLIEPFTRHAAGGMGLMQQRYTLAAFIAEHDA
jgi:hypothetical protein